MEAIFQLIQENPKYFAWGFGVINVFWGAFLYFNKKSHEKELEKLKQTLALESEMRRKNYELKHKLYTDYLTRIDAMFKKEQESYYDAILPIFNRFFNSYLKAEMSEDSAASTESITAFINEVQLISLNGREELQAIEQQTNALRLVASNNVVDCLDQLSILYKNLFNESMRQINTQVELIKYKNEYQIQKNKEYIDILASEIQSVSTSLKSAMREDIQSI